MSGCVRMESSVLFCMGDYYAVKTALGNSCTHVMVEWEKIGILRKVCRSVRVIKMLFWSIKLSVLMYLILNIKRYWNWFRERKSCLVEINYLFIYIYIIYNEINIHLRCIIITGDSTNYNYRSATPSVF